MDLELVMCLAGNLFGIYIISRFFSIFFETEGTQKRKGLRFFCYGFYYALNSMVLFVFMDRRLSLFFRMFSDACWFPGVIKAAGSTDSAL